MVTMGLTLPAEPLNVEELPGSSARGSRRAHDCAVDRIRALTDFPLHWHIKLADADPAAFRVREREELLGRDREIDIFVYGRRPDEIELIVRGAMTARA